MSYKPAWIRKLFYRNHCVDHQVSPRRDPRHCRNPFWTGHAWKGALYYTKVPRVLPVWTEEAARNRNMFFITTFCLLHLTKHNQYKNKHILTAESWWGSWGEITSFQKFMPLSKTTRAQKYTTDPQWAWWVSEQSPKCSVHFFKVARKKNCIKVLVTEYEKTKKLLKTSESLCLS